MRLLLATRNEHKAREFAALLAPHEVVSLPADVALPPETGATFADNALGKARAAARATGLPTIADDSGIEAAALGGRPGVLSARFAGEDATDEQNLAKLVAEAPAGSALAYVCAIALVDPRNGGQERVFEGRCAGRMAARPRGDGGFGYDPCFVPDDLPPQPERTMAELSPAEKDAISHRGRAARALRSHLDGLCHETVPAIGGPGGCLTPHDSAVNPGWIDKGSGGVRSRRDRRAAAPDPWHNSSRG